MPDVVLYQFPPVAGLPSFSPFCWKVQMALNARAVPHRIENILFARRRNPHGKLPYVVWDGEGLEDSSAIARAIDERATGGPRLVPSDAPLAAEAHVLEDWADESLYFIGIYYQWRDREGAAEVPRAFYRIPVVGRVAYPLFDRVIQRQLRGQGIARKPPEHVAADLERHLDAIESLLEGREFLLDRGPLLCDFAMASQLHYLRRTPVAGRALASRTAILAYLDRMKALRR